MLFEHTFEKCTEILDGNQYKACEFRNCTLIYRGGSLPQMHYCHFSECSWKFEAAADRTIAFLKGLYHGGLGGKELIEAAFNNIRRSR